MKALLCFGHLLLRSAQSDSQYNAKFAAGPASAKKANCSGKLCAAVLVTNAGMKNIIGDD